MANPTIEHMRIWFPKGVTELKAGTPIDEKGNVTSAANAHGFLKHDIHFPAGKAPVVVNGGAADWTQNDPTAPDYVRNRPFYEGAVENDITGTEITLSKYWSSTEVAHNQNIPFALGQVWDTNISGYSGLEVQEATDGTLYIGTYPNADNIPFYITSNTLKANGSWVSNAAPKTGVLTCVSCSGTIHQMDAKFLPPHMHDATTDINGVVPVNSGGTGVSNIKEAMAVMGQGYCACQTAAATVAKTGSISKFVLTQGALVGVYFLYANTATNPTLNISSTGAKKIYNFKNHAAVTSGDMGGACLHLFMYDGNNWVLLNPLT